MRCRCGAEIDGYNPREDYCSDCNTEIDEMLSSLPTQENKHSEDNI